MDPGFDRAISENDATVLEGTPYRSIIGCLLQIARQTVFSPLTCSHNILWILNKKHRLASKRVIAYLFETKDESLVIGNHRNSLSLQYYTDATWACDTSWRSGGVLNGSVLRAWSKQQPSTEAEYVSPAHPNQGMLELSSRLVWDVKDTQAWSHVGHNLRSSQLDLYFL